MPPPQINSETDFVARNEQFRALVSGAAAAALAVAPPASSGSSSGGRSGSSQGCALGDADLRGARMADGST